jgi:AmpD protein
MQVDEQGWLSEVYYYPSPNFDARPLGGKINLLVIHNISLPPGVWGAEDIIALFQNKLVSTRHPFYEQLKEQKVSSHFLIDREGEIYQFVSVFERAWHAGVSSFAGVDNCNDYSIGIELNGSDQQTFTEVQYRNLAILTNFLLHRFSDITLERIVGHADIAIPSGRKTDPGPCFDWIYYKKLLE